MTTLHDRPFTVDEALTVRAHGLEATARVVVVTGPASMVLEFVNGLSGRAQGYVGSMPVLRRPDGVWIEILNTTPVTIQRAGD